MTRLTTRVMILASFFLSSASAQLSGPVGTLTTSAQKAGTKVCNILDYGGKAGADGDIGTAIMSAWAACKSGGQVLIPSGEYGLATWVDLTGGCAVSINIEGIIYRTGTTNTEENMILIEHSSDVELYSATGKGAIQAYGYEFHKEGKTGARILKLSYVTNFTVHDLALVDAPGFHMALATCSSGEVYNMIIHGGFEGNLDGMSVWGSNIHIHDVEVSNYDECVTIKTPANNILVESIHCNWSGGCAMGSLTKDTNIQDIEYRNIYTHNSYQMYKIKSNGGNGVVQNVALVNFMGHSNSFALDFDSAYSGSVSPGNGIDFHNISFSSWVGTVAKGAQRGPIMMNCPAKQPCYDVTITDFSVWTDSGNEVLYVCENAYGSGACLKSAQGTAGLSSYTTTQTITATPSGWKNYQTMDNELSTGFDPSSSIPIPSLPSSFFPGIAPINAIPTGA